MKPKTKEQIHVFELYSKLKPLTDKQKEYASSHCFNAFYYTNNGKKNIKYYCSHCGGESLTREKYCPHCHRKIDNVADKNRMFKNQNYFIIGDTISNYQVIRCFEVVLYTKRQAPERFCIQEVVCIFYSSEGKKTVVTRKRPMFTFYSNWIWSSNMEIRSNNSYHDISYGVDYPYFKISKVLKRNGLTRNTHGIHLVALINNLFDNNHFESMWKLGYHELCKASFSRYDLFTSLWPQIIIANRCGFLKKLEETKDYDIWYDYIYDLRRLTKDITNPNILCPENLHQAHIDTSLALERRRERKYREDSLKEKLKHEQEDIQSNKKYLKDKGPYLGINLHRNGIYAKVLQNVEEFFQEGTAMHHCVYTNKYFNKDCLIFSTRNSNGKRIATVEWNIENKKIVQIRSYCNKTPEEYNEIVELFEKNIDRIIPKRIRSKKDDKVLCSKGISC